MNYFDKVKASPKISDNDKYYWGYMYNLANEFIVPLLKEKQIFKPGMSVCEIGCAEGGTLAAFVEAGAKDALGTDIAVDRLETGKQINEVIGIGFELSEHNILSDKIDAKYIGKYDLVLLRDVLEHLENTETALRAIMKILKPGGRLYVTFPPYYSPYGGHQHTLVSTIGKIPYLHFLPANLLHSLIKNGRKADVVEVMRLKNIRLTPHKFYKIAKNLNFKIIMEQYYFIRPVYKMKFNLPAVSSNPMRHFPLVKSVLSTEAGFVLENPQD